MLQSCCFLRRGTLLPLCTQSQSAGCGAGTELRGQHKDADQNKGGRPRRKAAKENKAAKDTDTDLIVKLEWAVGLLDSSLLSVRQYELLNQHILWTC
jgi:hypothetical protein